MEFLTIKTQYNYEEAWQWLQQKGNEIHGRDLYYLVKPLSSNAFIN
jgi:hypothetical protein